MSAINTSQKMRTGIKSFVDHLGVGGWLRQMYVDTLVSGERAKFTLTGWPPASSTILLAGAGRSGTTWLADVICMLPRIQQVFEPLHPRYNPDVHRITNWVWDETPQSHEHKVVYIPPEPELPEWTLSIERALTGRIRNYFTDSVRTSLFPDRFLVKDIWANLMLGYIANRFQPKIIYILRHPCAVIHSRLGVNWKADVQDILSQPQLVSDYLSGLEEDIRNEKDTLGAHAVWWAVENHVALHQLQQFPHFLVYYEELTLHPRRVLEKLIAWLGYNETPLAITRLLDKPSRTSRSGSASIRNIDHLGNWKDDLIESDQNRILNWAKRLGLHMYNSDILPDIPAFADLQDITEAG